MVRDCGGEGTELKQPDGQAALFAARSSSSLSVEVVSAAEQETNDATVYVTVPVRTLSTEELLLAELMELLCDEEDRLEAAALELDEGEEDEDEEEEENDESEEEKTEEEEELLWVQSGTAWVFAELFSAFPSDCGWNRRMLWYKTGALQSGTE